MPLTVIQQASASFYHNFCGPLSFGFAKFCAILLLCRDNSVIEVGGPQPFQLKLLATTQIASMAEVFQGVVDRAKVKVIPASLTSSGY